MIRLLMDPTAEAGGGNVDPPKAAEAKAETALATATAATPAPNPGTVAVDQASYRAEQDELTRLRKAESDRARAAREAEEEKLRERGKHEEIIGKRDLTIAEKDAEIARVKSEKAALERETADSFIDRDLSLALGVDGLVPNGAAQLLQLWKADFEARRVDGRWVVQAKAGGSVADVVKARLATPDYAHFLRAGSRGGAGGNGQATTATPAATAAPANSRDRLAREMLAAGGKGFGFSAARQPRTGGVGGMGGSGGRN